MSVLSFPRIYFKGYVSWDPCTFNNNDWQAFPTYDGTNAALNWAFLATQGSQPAGITPANFTQTFRPWAITLQDDTNPNDAPPGKRIPTEWNMFGSHAVEFVQYASKTTHVTGGTNCDGEASPAPDPLVGKPIAIAPACLVNTNPASFWASQIYWNKFTIGNPQPGVAGLTGNRQFRMHSRWVNRKRIYSATRALTQPAAAFGTCFQTCIPTNDVTFTNGNPRSKTYSPLMAALEKAACQPGALGVMVRFSAYVNMYFQNGIFNNTTQQPRTYQEFAELLAKAWDAWNSTGDTSQFFSQPCYSHLVGVVGIWNQGELASVPVGRFLAATQNSVNPVPPPSQSTPVFLGPLVAHVEFDKKLISLDMNSTIPEVATSGTSASDLSKVNVGPITVGAQAADGTFTPLASPIPYSGYQKLAYEASAGIVDVPIVANTREAQDAVQGLKDGTNLLAIQMQGQTTLAEQSGGYSAQTDSRGIYLDENEQTEFEIAVYKSGAPAPAPAS